MEYRYTPLEFETRDDGGGPVIEGYFAVFNAVTTLWPGATESIAPGAFDGSADGDVRALYNHNADCVLGRTTAGTLELRQDSHGLWGRIHVNREDAAAMDVYRRIQRGDVSGASFGFDIRDEEEEVRADGSIHWTIRKADPLWEVSPCTFPQYGQTDVSARSRRADEIHRRQLSAWKARMKEGLKNGTKGADASKED